MVVVIITAKGTAIKKIPVDRKFIPGQRGNPKKEDLKKKILGSTS
jgi:hypothetical protein